MFAVSVHVQYVLLVWIVISSTVTKVVEGCVYLRRRWYAIFGMLSGGEFELSALRSLLRYSFSSLPSIINTTTIKDTVAVAKTSDS